MEEPRYKRISTRLSSWDYRFPGWYFITICTKNKKQYFGKISSSLEKLTPIGEIANQYWIEIPSHFINVEIDEYIITPNHVHGILILQSKKIPKQALKIDDSNSHHLPKPKSLSSIIRSYKSAVTRWARSNGYQYFAWQLRFYDHIIRDDEDLRRIRQYIQENPLKWELDEYFKPIAP